MTQLYNAQRRACLQGAAGLTLATLGAPLTLMPLSARAQVLDLNDAINKAGRQRMLSQRMAKAWMAIGQGVDTVKAGRIMSESMALFDRQLVELKAYAPSAAIRTTYQQLEEVWGDYKTALVGAPPRKEQAAMLLSLDAKVLQLAHQGTTQLEKVSGKPAGKLVNLAGRQRMLSQRSAKCYLSITWADLELGQQRELDIAKREFVDALAVLEAAPEATPTIRDELSLARQQWVFFDNALSRIDRRSRTPRHSAEVLRSSENILQIMDRVTGLYARLS
jgi:nitrate/nitrite-specific signal transduction histidine kinase